MNVNFNYRANTRFVVTCQNHDEIDRLASKVAAEVRAEQLAAEAPHCTSKDCCATANGCKFTVSEDHAVKGGA